MKNALVLDLQRSRTVRMMRFVLFCVALFLLGILAGIHLQKSKLAGQKNLIWKSFGSQPAQPH